jgi:hypothetical protein
LNMPAIVFMTIFWILLGLAYLLIVFGNGFN